MHAHARTVIRIRTTFSSGAFLLEEPLGFFLEVGSPVRLAGIVFCTANNCPQFHFPSLWPVDQ